MSPTKFYRKTLRRGGVLPRPREGQSPSPTHHKIRFRRGRCLHRPARAYTAPLVNGVIAKPVRTLAVAIRSPLDLHRGITDSHDQSADWSRNDRFIARGAVDDRRWSALSPPCDGKIFCPVCPVLFVYRPIFFRQSHQHRLGSIRKNLCVCPIFPRVTNFPLAEKIFLCYAPFNIRKGSCGYD